MNKNYLKSIGVGAMAVWLSTALNAQTTFSYTGALQTYTVPAGVNMIQIECWGAQGESVGSSTGGLGGYVSGELVVTPGEILNVYVGGQTGFNGGGTSGSGSGYLAGIGGGASDVRQGGTAFTDRVIVAGAGGGCGRSDCSAQTGGAGAFPGGYGGVGDGVVGGDGAVDGGSCIGSGGCGACCSSSLGGGGGGSNGGGAQGGYGTALGGTGGACGGDNDSYSGGCSNEPGGGGCFGLGGNGINPTCNGGGGGGGGGWYGGGSGGANWGSGGGGGSSYFDPAMTSTSFTNGTNSGNGQVIITDLCLGLTTSVSDDEVCDGETVTLSASSTVGGTVTWDGGITDGVAFTPALGTTTYTATSDDPGDCGFSVDITVNPLPTVDGGSDIDACEDETVTLAGTGTADTYSWDGGVTDGVAFTPAGGTTTYTVTGTITSTGCQETDAVDVNYTLVDEGVTVTGATLTSDQAGATYEWIDCADSTIAGETNQSYTATQDGDYAVVATINGCSDTSACVNISGVGMSSGENQTLRVYPNPANNEVTVSLPGSFQYELRSMTGALLATGNGSGLQVIPLSAFTSGTYTLSITQKGETVIRELIIAK